MNRTLRLLSACLVFSAVACGDNQDKQQQAIKISLFQAAPDTIEAGQSTKLLFVVDPADAKVMLSDVGDVTGQVQASVTPAATTVYHLTATKGALSATADATVNVTITRRSLVYTAPTSGRVRLVANALSTPDVVQLDLVANERLEVSSFFGGGPGSFAAGMNLPLDTTRVGPDTNLFATGNALVVQPAGTPPPPAIQPVGAGVLNSTDHTLYTAVSRKRVAGAVFNQETEVQPGRVFFSIRLKMLPNAKAGVVFDGAQPSPNFRAAVRDQFGDDFVSQNDIGIGKLVVQ